MQELEKKIKQLEDEKVSREVDNLAAHGIYRKPYTLHQIERVTSQKMSLKVLVLQKCQSLMGRVNGNHSLHSFPILPQGINGRKNRSWTN
jgi:hypothetical protein